MVAGATLLAWVGLEPFVAGGRSRGVEVGRNGITLTVSGSTIIYSICGITISMVSR
jgi:hypothetical protein